jgi:prepilin-type processing-associated H-X9-DG protein
VPPLKEGRRQAKVLLCLSNLRQYAMGLAVYATSDSAHKYPVNTIFFGGLEIWSSHSSWQNLVNAPDRDAYIANYTEVVGGGSRAIFQCPLDRAYNPMISGSYSYGGGGGYDDLWYHGSDSYLGGYRRWANCVNADFTHSGNHRTDKPPTNPGAGAQDAILVDRTVSEPIGWYQEPHMRFYYLPNAEALEAHKEVNVGYADGHVERHKNEAWVDGAFLTWDDAHWIPYAGERLIY